MLFAGQSASSSSQKKLAEQGLFPGEETKPKSAEKLESPLTAEKLESVNLWSHGIGLIITSSQKSFTLYIFHPQVMQ